MKKLLAAVFLLIAPSIAWAQCSGVFPNNTICGNITGTSNTPRAVIASSFVTSSVAIKDSVDLATTNNITLSGEQTIDGVLTASSRVLVKDQSSASQNGIYTSSSGAWIRTSDWNATGQVSQGTSIYVNQGTVNAHQIFYVLTAGTITPGTTSVSLDSRPEVISASLNGVKCDGITDDTSAIQAAINQAESSGSKIKYIIFPRGACLVSSTLTVNTSNTFLIGQGSDYWGVSPIPFNSVTGTAFVWIGSSGGTIIQYITPSNSASVNSGGGVRGFSFYSDNATTVGTGASAGIGLDFVSWGKSQNSELTFFEFSTAGLRLYNENLVNAPNNATQFNRFIDIQGFVLQKTAPAILLTADVSVAALGNSSFNTFESVDIFHNNGPGVEFGIADNNYINGIRIFRYPGGTGNSILFDGNNASQAFVANYNIVNSLSASAAAIGKGTTTYTYASLDNQLTNMDAGNGTPQPTLETGATIQWSFNNGVAHDYTFYQLAVGDNLTNTALAQANIGLGTLAIANSSSSHILIGDNSWSTVWGINLTGNDLRFNQISGTPGSVILPNITANGVLIGSGANILGSTIGLTSGQIVIGQTSGVPTPKTVSGDISLDASGDVTVSKVNGVAYPSSPVNNTIPVVTGTNSITYEKAPLSVGGTNADLSSTGGSSQVLQQSSVGAAITVGQLGFSNLSNYTDFTSWSPTWSPTGGSTTSSIISAKYTVINKLVCFNLEFNITADTGTGTGHFSLPLTPANNATGTGYETTAGRMSSILITGGSSTASVLRYDSAYPLPGGATFWNGSACYQSQ